MGDTVRAFVVTVAVDEVDGASDLLWQLGVRAIEERPAAGDRVELWTSVGEEQASIDRAIAALGGRWAYRVADVESQPVESWREHAVAMWVHDRLVIVPAWQEPAVDAGEVVVVPIEPGGAFGLGDHPTTLGSVRALADLLQRRDGDVDVLDVGCGTGVLAVVAARLQQRPVRAIDVATAAVEATVDNARRNGVADRIEVDTSPLAEVVGDFDVVVANILAPTLIALADDLRRVTRPTGRLVISGILTDSHEHVLDALAPMEVEATVDIDGWACVTLRHG